MMEKKIGCLPVVEGTKLVGIVTETDMLKLVAEM
jgi:CBS domain-containing protein